MQEDRQDRSAVGWEHVEKSEKHSSQKGQSHADSCPVFYFFLNCLILPVYATSTYQKLLLIFAARVFDSVIQYSIQHPLKQLEVCIVLKTV